MGFAGLVFLTLFVRCKPVSPKPEYSLWESIVSVMASSVLCFSEALLLKHTSMTNPMPTHEDITTQMTFSSELKHTKCEIRNKIRIRYTIIMKYTKDNTVTKHAWELSLVL